MPSPEEPSHENEAAQTLSQLSDFALRQSQTLSQFNEAVELQYRGGSQPSSHPLFGAPTPEFGPLGLSSQAGESIPAAPVAPVPKPIQHYSGDAPSNAPPGRLHRTARGTRRGPMDEMRQLARIMVKIIPHSVGFLVVSEEGGGGNKITEEQIRAYLEKTLGEAPRPGWGVPAGWGGYLAELFTWVLEKKVSEEQAMRCAKREAGRPWEANEPELHKLGLYPDTWPLPLTRAGLDNAKKNPVRQAMPPLPAGHSERAKRKADRDGTPGVGRRASGGGGKRGVVDLDGDAGTPTAAAAKRRAPPSASSRDPFEHMEALGEMQLWQCIADMLVIAHKKAGTAPAEHIGQVLRCKTQVLKEINEQLLMTHITPTSLIPPTALTPHPTRTSTSPPPTTVGATRGGQGGAAVPVVVTEQYNGNTTGPHGAVQGGGGALASVPASVEVRPVLFKAPDGTVMQAYQLSNTQVSQPVTLAGGLQSLAMLSTVPIVTPNGVAGVTLLPNGGALTQATPLAHTTPTGVAAAPLAADVQAALAATMHSMQEQERAVTAGVLTVGGAVTGGGELAGGEGVSGEGAEGAGAVQGAPATAATGRRVSATGGGEAAGGGDSAATAVAQPSVSTSRGGGSESDMLQASNMLHAVKSELRPGGAKKLPGDVMTKTAAVV